MPPKKLPRGLLTDPNIQAVIQYASENKVNDRQLAYILATMGHETGDQYKPVRELHNGNPQEDFKDYSGGWKYSGRGYVQLTHDYNYKWANQQLKKAGINAPDLLKEPDWLLKNTPESRRANAALMTEGMMQGQYGKPLTQYVNDKKSDYQNARMSVNSLDKKTYTPIANRATQWEGLISTYRAEQEQRRQQGMNYINKTTSGNGIQNTNVGIPQMTGSRFHRGGN